MNYVLDENGNIKIGQKGHPLVKGKDGKEFEVDAIGAQDKINTVTAESNDRRKKLGEANIKLETFIGIDDPKKALEALQKVGSISSENEVKIEELKTSINEGWTVKQTEWETEKASLNDKLFDSTVGSKFANSKAIKETVLPPDIAKATFGSFFKPDGTAIDREGKQIYSKEKPGEPAGFEESISHLIQTYPNRDDILKASDTNGTGGFNDNNGGGNENVSSVDNIKAGLAARK